MTTFLSLLGGLGLFLLGMSMMTDGLKVAAGNALKTILQSWTRSSLRGLLAGALITGVVQSSSAVTVATVGFVNAGLLTLSQAVFVVFGANVGTTMTGWLVALVGVKIDVGALALPLLGAGMLARLAARGHVARAGLGQALAGFGAFFLGVGVLQEAFSSLTPALSGLNLADTGPLALAAFLGLGALLTVLTQSSSAAIAIALTASAGGAVPLAPAAALVVGTNIGTTSTAIFASLGATAPARRVALAHIAFNLSTGFVALLALPLLLAASERLAGMIGHAGDETTTLAVFHTLFNCLGVALAWPFAGRFVRYLQTLFVTPDETIGAPKHLDPTLAGVPAIALRALSLETARMMDVAFSLARARIDFAQASPRDAALRREGVMRLGESVRAFIARLSAEPLPQDVVAALPDLIRAVQHLEEVAALSTEIDPAFIPPGGGPENWARLKTAAKEAMSVQGDGALAAPERIGALIAETEAAYQAVKSDLLASAASGRLAVPAMETALRSAQRLRRCAEAALKAARRLGPWIENGQAQPEAATAPVPASA